MSQRKKRMERVITGASLANIDFDELCSVMIDLGFSCKDKPTSHRVYTREGIADIVNLQPGRDGKAKPYQVRQIRDLVAQHQLLQSLLL
jgi:hypothetical protein